MNRIILFVCILVCGFMGSAIAQEMTAKETPEELPRFYFNAFAGAWSNPIGPTSGHYGGGGEFRIKNFLLGGEAVSGKLYNVRLSINSSYHFVTRHLDQKLDPFLSGGITWNLYFVPGWDLGEAYRMIYFGVGSNYWFSPQFGLKLEVRDNVWPTNGTAFHYMDTRVGVCFGIR
jgi:hypothetical protein